jgi:hypothetical protein
MNKILICLSIIFLLCNAPARCGENYVGVHANLSHQIKVINKNIIFWNINNIQYRLSKQVVQKNRLLFSPFGSLNFSYRNDFYNKKVSIGFSTGLGYYLSSRQIEWEGTGINGFNERKSFVAQYKSFEHGIEVPALLNVTWANINFSTGLLFKGRVYTSSRISYVIENGQPFEGSYSRKFVDSRDVYQYFSISMPFAFGYFFNLGENQRVNISLEYYLGVFDRDAFSVGVVPQNQVIRNDFLGLGLSYQYHLKNKRK